MYDLGGCQLENREAPAAALFIRFSRVPPEDQVLGYKRSANRCIANVRGFTTELGMGEHLPRRVRLVPDFRVERQTAETASKPSPGGRLGPRAGFVVPVHIRQRRCRPAQVLEPSRRPGFPLL